MTMQQPKSISATVNGQFKFSPAELEDLDFIPIDDRHFHILAGGQSFRAELVQAQPQQKAFTIKVNGTKFDIQLADEYDQMIDRLGLSVVANHGAQDIKAPMPGLVLQVMVAAGDVVVVGQALLILEAMKMENVIKATATGTVQIIQVSQGAPVEKGQLLIKMEA